MFLPSYSILESSVSSSVNCYSNEWKKDHTITSFSMPRLTSPLQKKGRGLIPDCPRGLSNLSRHLRVPCPRQAFARIIGRSGHVSNIYIYTRTHTHTHGLPGTVNPAWARMLCRALTRQIMDTCSFALCQPTISAEEEDGEKLDELLWMLNGSEFMLNFRVMGSG